MPLQSTVAGVMVALHELWAPLMAAHDSRRVVYLGPPSGGDVPQRYTAIGYAGGEPGNERPAVVGRGRPPEMGNRGQQSSEEYDLWCAVASGTGDEGDAALMEVMGLTDAAFQVLAEAVRINRTLGGVLKGGSLADIGRFEWSFTDGGGICTVFFTVQVDAGWVE